MRKLFGLLAALFMLFGMNASGASAQEAPPQEEAGDTTTTVVDEPAPPTCGEPETLTKVDNPGGWIDIYNSDGELCAQVAGEQTAPTPAPEADAPTAPRPELARTGSGTLYSAIAGFSLLLVGIGVEWGGKRRKAALN